MITFLNFFRLVHIHPVLILFIFIAILTGSFTHLLILLLIVFIHELGHFIAATYFKWRIRGMMLWVFGGVMQTEEVATRPLHEEVIVTLAGPLQHLFIYLLLLFFSYIGFMPDVILQQTIFYNGLILAFNLLPIYPLDGGKLLFLLLSTCLPFQLAHRYTIFFSLVACVFLILFQIILPFTLTAILLIVFLILENKNEWKNRSYIFMRFLIQRLTMKQQQNRVKKIIANDKDDLMAIFKQFFRTRIHLIFVERKKIITERDCLFLYFYEKKYTETIGELMNDKKN